MITKSNNNYDKLRKELPSLPLMPCAKLICTITLPLKFRCRGRNVLHEIRRVSTGKWGGPEKVFDLHQNKTWTHNFPTFSPIQNSTLNQLTGQFLPTPTAIGKSKRSDNEWLNSNRLEYSKGDPRHLENNKMIAETESELMYSQAKAKNKVTAKQKFGIKCQFCLCKLHKGMKLIRNQDK